MSKMKFLERFQRQPLPEKEKKICPKHGEQQLSLRFNTASARGDYCIACIVENVIQPNAHRFDKE